MGKVRYTEDIEDYYELDDLVDYFTLELTTVSSTEMIFEDAGGARMVLTGTGIKGSTNNVTGGTIRSAEFINSEGETLYRFSGLDVAAANIDDVFELYQNQYRIMHALMQDDDKVTGSSHSDYLWGFAGDDKLDARGGADLLHGHGGNDVLTGGTGADTFAFYLGYGRDRITDFELNGQNHDRIEIDLLEYDSAKITQKQKDVWIDLGEGDILIVEDVKRSRLTDEYFDFY